MGFKAVRMHGLPDACGTAGAWPHLAALPESGPQEPLRAPLSSPSAWPRGRRPGRGHLPQPDGREIPQREVPDTSSLGACRAGVSTGLLGRSRSSWGHGVPCGGGSAARRQPRVPGAGRSPPGNPSRPT